MGKAKILSHQGEGLYTVEIMRDFERVNALIATIDARLAVIEGERTTLEAEETVLETQLSDIQWDISNQIDIAAERPTEQEILNAEHEVAERQATYDEFPTFPNLTLLNWAIAALAELMVKDAAAEGAVQEIIRLLSLGFPIQESLRVIAYNLASLNLEETSIDLRKAALTDELGYQDIRDVWCADYSKNLMVDMQFLIDAVDDAEAEVDRIEADPLASEQELIDAQAALVAAQFLYDSAGNVSCEINGEPTDIILWPGELTAPEIPSESGILTPIIGQSVAQACFNFALYPGWQKWKPTYRIGTITDINKMADTCSVDLDEASSIYQSIDINIKEDDVQQLLIAIASMEAKIVGLENDLADDMPQLLIDIEAAEAEITRIEEEMAAEYDMEQILEDIATAEAAVASVEADPLATEQELLDAQAALLEAQAALPDQTELVAARAALLAIQTVILDAQNVILDAQAALLALQTQYNDVEKILSSNIPIEYMSCNADAFNIDDRVLVQFQGQGWGNPRVIGFESEPKSCVAGFIIVVTSQSGEEAFAWDIVTDSIFIAVSDSETVFAAIHALGFTMTLATETASVDDVWYLGPALAPYPPYDAALNLPVLYYGNYPGDGMSDELSPVFPYTYSNPNRAFSFSHPYMELDGEADIAAPYVIFLYGEATHPTYGIQFIRQYLYFHSMFDFDLDGFLACKPNLDAATTPMFDNMTDSDWTFEDGEWQVSPWNAWMDSGVAVNIAGSLMYEYMGVCFHLTDDLTACSDYIASHRNLFQIYTRQNNQIEGNDLDGFDLVNAERTALGLAALKINANLQAAAERHAADMAEHYTTSHTGSDASSTEDRILDANYMLYHNYTAQAYAYGENTASANLAFDTIADVVAAWMASPGHMANIIDSDYAETGFAVVAGDDGNTYFCQTFGYRANVWPGFASFDTTALKSYMETNFNFDGEGDETHVPLVYLS